MMSLVATQIEGCYQITITPIQLPVKPQVLPESKPQIKDSTIAKPVVVPKNN